MTGLKLTLKSSFSFEIAVKGYNPAPREMRGNLMDSNLEQDTIRELGMRKQVCEWEEYSELTGPNSYIYGLFVLGYSIQGYRNRVTNSNYAMCVLKYGGSWILADLITLQIKKTHFNLYYGKL